MSSNKDYLLESLNKTLASSSFVSPESLTLKIPKSQTNPAEWTYDCLVEYFQNFQERLNNQHEVGAYLANFPGGAVHISGIWYSSPNIVTFYGRLNSGDEIQLIQHVTQLNVTLIAVKKLDEKATRIGF